MIFELSDEYKKELIDKFENINIIEDLVKIQITYLDFNNKVKEGNIICNRLIANKLINIFNELFDNNYQIEKINLIDNYNWNDIESMSDNNTSCFNYRRILNSDNLLLHAYGLAIDINPLYNPYQVDNTNIVLPENGIEYFDRNKIFPHKIDKDDLCYKLFKENGFEWGGDWEYPDYQHFQYKEKMER